MGTALSIEQLNKRFIPGRAALNQINISVDHGEMIALIGASGSGKSTLLRHIAGLIPADSDSVSCIRINGECAQEKGKISNKIRHIRKRVGFIFQQFNLVDRLPVHTNVLIGLLHSLPLWRSLFGLFNASERAKAYDALKRVGIAECHAQRASTLSGGQQQRAAIARTLVQGADLILADEPIASLDPESSRNVMDILSRINREDGSTVIVSLHQVEIAIRYCPRVIALHKGSVVYDGPSSNLTPDLLRSLYGVQVDEILSTQSLHTPTPIKPAAHSQPFDKEVTRLVQVA
ncbi:MAG: phosphonate ABC transporter ATP-binding protein [Sheuella sp.]|nr:phosphonate ABC transporter ATP-binding protein [Sheuella sp.]